MLQMQGAKGEVEGSILTHLKLVGRVNSYHGNLYNEL